MSGCGIRALRWGLSTPEDGSRLELGVNDADPDRLPLLEQPAVPSHGLRPEAE